MLDRRLFVAATLASTALGSRLARARVLPQPTPASLTPPRDVPATDGYAQGPNGAVYWRRFGGGDRLPLVILHGGPAAAHDYLLPYAQLARGRTVACYDQSGCGRSARPADLTRYTLDRYVEELEAVRAALGFERMALLGHSWGGHLAPAYAARYPQHVGALVLAGTSVRWLDFQRAADRWLAELGPDAVATVAQAKATGRTDAPAYQALTERYYQLHFCRLQTWPKLLTDAAAALGSNPVYPYLNGPTEFQFTGKFADLDNSAALATVRVPTLVTCGEFDEAPPWIGRELADRVKGAHLMPFTGLSHVTHIEDPARVVGATGRFLASVA